MVSSSRAALLALIAFVALATTVVAQTCVVTVINHGTDSTCSAVNATVTRASLESDIGCVSSGSFSYLATSCQGALETSSYSVTVWNPEAGGCTGGSGTTASGTGVTACTAVSGGGLPSAQYVQVNCSCSAIIPAVSSSSAIPTSSSSTGSSSSAGGIVIDTGCPRRVTQYSDSTCTTQSSALDFYSQQCAAFPTSLSSGYYLSLACPDTKENANWALAVYELSTCKGSVITQKVADISNPTACTTASTLGGNLYFKVNCSCDGGRKYSTGIQSSSSTGSSISGSTSMTSVTSMTSMTSLTSVTSTTARGSSSTGSSSTTGRTSSAPASRSSVVAIVAAVAAGVVALMA